MRHPTTSLQLLRRRPRPGASRLPDEAGAPWSAHRVLLESERVVGRLQQLEARPWWRVSRRELDELDARLDVLRAHAAHTARG